MQHSKSCQAALTPVYDWSKAHQSSASGWFAFMRKRGKSISPQQWWPTACAASWFWAPSLNPGCCTQPCPHLGRAEQLLLFSLCFQIKVWLWVFWLMSSREAGNPGKCDLWTVADAFVSIVPLLILFLPLWLIFPCATLSWLCLVVLFD